VQVRRDCKVCHEAAHTLRHAGMAAYVDMPARPRNAWVTHAQCRKRKVMMPSTARAVTTALQSTCSWCIVLLPPVLCGSPTLSLSLGVPGLRHALSLQPQPLLRKPDILVEVTLLSTILKMVAPKPINHRPLQFLTIRIVKLPHLGLRSAGPRVLTPRRCYRAWRHRRSIRAVRAVQPGGRPGPY
jgi:hypothetical protein